MARQRFDAVKGVTGSALDLSTTSISSPGLAGMGAVTSPNTALICLFTTDTNGNITAHENVYVTNHTAGNTSATITRAGDGTVAQAWPIGTTWVHGFGTADVADILSQMSVGPQGSPGAPGPQGDAGAAATVSVGSTTTGAAGSSAAVSNSGSSSAAIFNFTIPTGATGAQGVAGDKYQTVSSSSLTIGTGSKSLTVGTGLAWTTNQGVVISLSTSNYMVGTVTSYNSSTGAMVANVDTIVGSGSGSSWTVNLDGASGPQGQTGTAATVSVGSTTTGAAGSSASVSNSGSSSAAVLNFTIPTGATGATGSTGATGATGSTGATGAQGSQGVQGFIPVVQTAADATSISPVATNTLISQSNTQSVGTLTINNPTGSPQDGQMMTFRLKCTNVQNLSWGSAYKFGADMPSASVTPPTTGGSLVDYIGFRYYSSTSTWHLVGYARGIG